MHPVNPLETRRGETKRTKLTTSRRLRALRPSECIVSAPISPLQNIVGTIFNINYILQLHKYVFLLQVRVCVIFQSMWYKFLVKSCKVKLLFIMLCISGGESRHIVFGLFNIHLHMSILYQGDQKVSGILELLFDVRLCFS